MKRAKDARQVRLLLRDLDLAQRYPYLVRQCLEKSNAESLFGFGWWLRAERTCKVCHRRLAPDVEKTCSERCAKRLRGWKKAALYRKHGWGWWPDYVQSVSRSVPIDVIATRMGLSVEDARQRAEVDVRSGRLRAWRGAKGTAIREVGVPR